MRFPGFVHTLATTRFYDEQHPFSSPWYDTIPSSSPSTYAWQWAQRYGPCGSQSGEVLQEVLTRQAQHTFSQNASHRIRIRIMRCYRDPQESCSASNLRTISLCANAFGTAHRAAATSRFTGDDDRVFPGVTMPIAISACTDTPTDNGTPDYLPS